MVKIVDEIIMSKPGGFGGGRGTVDYAEKLILEPDFLEMMSKLKVRTEKKDKDGKPHYLGGTIVLNREDLPEYFKTGSESVNGAAHKLNAVFVAMGAPFYATSLTSDDARKNKVEVEVTDEETGVKTVELKTIADQVAIYRISEVFEIDRYAAEGSVKLEDKVDAAGKVTKKGSTDYQQPTDSTKKYIEDWIAENGADNIESLKAIGVDFDTK